MKKHSMHRRNFLTTTTGASAGLALAGLSAPNPARSASPNDTIRVAVIGPGGRGTQLLKEGSAHETEKIVR